MTLNWGGVGGGLQDYEGRGHKTWREERGDVICYEGQVGGKGSWEEGLLGRRAPGKKGSWEERLLGRRARGKKGSWEKGLVGGRGRAHLGPRVRRVSSP